MKTNFNWHRNQIMKRLSITLLLLTSYAVQAQVVSNSSHNNVGYTTEGEYVICHRVRFQNTGTTDLCSPQIINDLTGTSPRYPSFSRIESIGLSGSGFSASDLGTFGTANPGDPAIDPTTVKCIPPNGTVTLTYKVYLNPAVSGIGDGSTFTHSATVSGVDNNGSGSSISDTDTYTTGTLTRSNVIMGSAMQAYQGGAPIGNGATLTVNLDGTYDFTYRVTLGNYQNDSNTGIDATNIQFQDDFNHLYNFLPINTITVNPSAGGNLTHNPNFNGGASTVGGSAVTPDQVLVTGGTLSPDETDFVEIVLNVGPINESQANVNRWTTGVVSADQNVLGGRVSEGSVHGLDPEAGNSRGPADACGGGIGVRFGYLGNIIATKSLTNSVRSASGIPGHYDLSYTILIEADPTNNIDLRRLSAIDDLSNNFGTNYIGVVNGPVVNNIDATSAPSENSNFDGTNGSGVGSNIDLLAGAQTDILSPGQSFSISYTVEVSIIGAASPLANQVEVSAANTSNEEVNMVNDSADFIYEDPDGDGIRVADDLDNDNDGILDINEGCAEVILTPTYVSTTSVASPINTALFIPEATSNGIINNVGGASTDGHVYDSTPAGQINPTFSYTLVVPDHTYITTFEMYGAVGGAIIEQLKSYNVQITDTGSNTVIIDENASTAVDLTNGVPLTVAVNLVPGSYSILFTDTDIGRDNREFSEIRFTGTQCTLNTDGDLLFDYLDTDSDNDGCPDAVEGAGAFTTADLTTEDNLADMPADVDVNGVPNAGSQATTNAVTDDTDTAACTSPTSLDNDKDGILDSVDLDDDNDGIPDSIEGEKTCTVVADINTPGLATNSNLVSGGNTGTATLNGLNNGTFNFIGTVGGTARWTANGVQIQNEASVGNFIYAQPNNTDNSATTNVATYEFNFPSPVSDFEFFIGGLNNDDQATITAFIGATPIAVTPANFSEFSTAGLVPSGNTVRGTVFDGSPDPLVNTFKVTIFGDVDRVVITSGKANDANGNVTVGMYSFGFCSPSALFDFDQDGIPNSLDLDADNDGIPDVVEAGGTDDDRDGVIDNFTDADDDGLNDAQDNVDNGSGTGEVSTGTPLDVFNTDGNGNPDFLDIDADDDGIVDNIEAQTTGDYLPPLNADDDMDGIDNQYDVDFVGTAIYGIANTDGDPLPDYRDLDSDEDTIGDLIEGWDVEADGTPEVVPANADADGDGLDDNFDNDDTDPDPTNGQVPTDFPDAQQAGGDQDWRQGLDNDGDGILDVNDIDDDNDGILDTDEGTGDTDGDGVPDSFDLDSDNDGIPDIVEAGGEDADLDGDGEVDYPGFDSSTMTDANNNGLEDRFETNPLPDEDSDGDGIENRLDLDSDNDGLPDVLEAGGTDADGDGIIDGYTDVDGDGFADSVDSNDNTVAGALDGGTPLPYPNNDSDGIDDWLDVDSDNDGLTDVTEAGGIDTDNDGRIDGFTDTDMDGFADSVDTDDSTTPAVLDGSGSPLPSDDFDMDGRPNYLDIDSDNDGITDTTEAGGTDDDGNGEVDGFMDTDSDGFDDTTAANPLPVPNSDENTGDGPDYLDIDADDDGLPDNIEGQPTVGYVAPDGSSAPNGLDTAYTAGITPEDTDGDLIPDYLDTDSDNDQIDDVTEGGRGALTNVDTDGDGLDDGFEGMDTNDSTDVNDEIDDPTTLPDVQLPGGDVDYREGTDSDGDGVLDDQEIADGTDPNDPCDFVIDNITETQGGDWLVADCDGDGVTNEQEITDGTNPEDPCDFDTASVTVAQSGDYLISDCDGDGVTNGTEIEDNTDPEDPCDFVATSVTLDRGGDWLLADCDGDTIANGQETNDDTNPEDPCSSRGGTPPAGVPCDIIIETDLVNPGVNNGVFTITNIESYPDNTVRIYNRWGILVFETQNYNNGSNGFQGISNGRATIKQNEALPVGVYFYVIEYIKDGVGEVKNGYLYVNR